jgi:hypothetical protein
MRNSQTFAIVSIFLGGIDGCFFGCHKNLVQPQFVEPQFDEVEFDELSFDELGFDELRLFQKSIVRRKKVCTTKAIQYNSI